MSSGESVVVSFRYPQEGFEAVSRAAALWGSDVSGVVRAAFAVVARSPRWRSIAFRRARDGAWSGASRKVRFRAALLTDVGEWMEGEGESPGTLAASLLDLFICEAHQEFRNSVEVELRRLRVVRPPVAGPVVRARSVVLELDAPALEVVMDALALQREAFAVQAYCGEDDVMCVEDQESCEADRLLWLGKAFIVDLALRQLKAQLASMGDGPDESC